MPTEFENKVYRAISKIPRGEVRSYKWVAARIGNPGASRAVGNALHRNPRPVVVPCHRVIKSDGSIGGYAKGIAMKKRILMREGIDWKGGRCYNRKTRSTSSGSLSRAKSRDKTGKYVRGT